ncbi:unnamed protein product [Caenorhabditis sp. 36 PRJEB53466]|nr:unnamed protein product [Caenorhabditis sp. 36 PRJEB53466]
MPSKILLILGALVLQSATQVYPMTDIYGFYGYFTEPPHAKQRACALKVWHRLEQLCGTCDPGSDMLVRKCSEDISDVEIIETCCPHRVNIESSTSNGTTEPEKPAITTDGH